MILIKHFKRTRFPSIYIDNKIKRKLLHVTFSYSWVIEKILFWSQIFEMESLKDLYALRSLEFEIIFLVIGLCVRVNQKQILANTPNLVYVIG